MKNKKGISQLPLHLMLIPGIIIVLIYYYGPMVGICISFQDFNPAKGLLHSQWVGWKNFSYILTFPDAFIAIRNTVFIAVMKIIAGLVVPITISILLNEINSKFFKRGIQTIIYLPHFLSWIILGGILIDILSPSSGIVNQLLSVFGVKPIYFLGSPKIFPYVLVISDVWKEFGFNTIIYLAAIVGISPTLYEASFIDGANRWRQTWHITLPGMAPIIILMATLSIGNILNAGFEQVFTMYSPQVYSTGDIIDTFTYRLGLIDYQFGPATAIGLFKSAISFVFISTAYFLTYKLADYRIF